MAAKDTVVQTKRHTATIANKNIQTPADLEKKQLHNSTTAAVTEATTTVSLLA